MSEILSMYDKRNFIILIIGQLCSVFCTFMYDFAISLYVIDLGGSNVAYTTIMVLGMVARIFVNLLGGVLVDRINRKKIIVLCDLLSGAVLLPLMLFGNSPKYFLILIITILLNCLNAFFGLAFMSAVPNLFHEEKMVMAGNSIGQTVQAVSAILGPIVGAIVYNRFGLSIVIMLNLISFFGTGLLEVFLKYSSSATDKSENEEENYFKALGKGYKYIGSHANLRNLCFFYVIFQTLVAPSLSIMLPLVVYNELKMTSLSLSIIQAAYAIGVLIGAIWASTGKADAILSKFFSKIRIVGIALIGWLLLNIPVVSSASSVLITILLSVLVFVLSVVNMYLTVPLISYFQSNIDESMRGNLFGVITTALTIGTPVGGLIMGAFSDFVSGTIIVACSGLLLIITSFIFSKKINFNN